MRKYIIRFSAVILLLLMMNFRISVVRAEETYDAVYFGSHSCLVCQSLEASGVLEDIQDQGYTLWYMSEDNYKLFEEMFSRYAKNL